jgi:hypothetical protein
MMSERTSPNVEVIDLAPGLWIWRLEHPRWKSDHDWQQVVTCVCVEVGGERDTWSVDALVRRYGCRAFGPNVFDPDMGPPNPRCR